MGGAIITSLMTHNKGLPIDGAVLVAPALWNFSEKNFFKSLFMSLISKSFQIGMFKHLVRYGLEISESEVDSKYIKTDFLYIIGKTIIIE